MKQLIRILLGLSFLLLSGLFSIAFADITIDDNATLRSLNNNPTKLHNYLNKYQHVHLKTRDGAWVGRIILPNQLNKPINKRNESPSNILINCFMIALKNIL
jgi:hypothetical protein